MAASKFGDNMLAALLPFAGQLLDKFFPNAEDKAVAQMNMAEPSSSAAGSLYGGAYAVRHFGLQDWGQTFEGELALGGIRLLCGLPAWVIIRAAFLWVEKRKGKDIVELLTDAKEKT